MSKSKIIKVGVIAAPERAAHLTANISKQLVRQFFKHIANEINWEVERIIDPLTGAAESAQDILYHAGYIKRKRAWDYAICLTDLPIFHKKDIVAADISFNYGVAQISIPAFGWAPMQKRIEKTIIQLLAELYTNDVSDHPKNYHSRTSKRKQEKSITHIFKRQFPIMPIQRQENPNISFKSDLIFDDDVQMAGSENSDKQDDHDTKQEKYSNEANDNNIDVRFIVYPRINGRLRLILGMTFANNPMKIMSSFKNVIAIAFTTGAFALIFPTIWNLGHTFSIYRLSGMMVAAMIGLVAWIIIVHNLWESPSKKNKPNIRRLYNLATISTLLTDVVTYYIFMFMLFLLACLVFIPVDYFQSMIHDYDDASSTFINYMRVAWATTSISTIVSAIGAGLENESLVRNITYGYRQSCRYEKINHTKRDSS